MNSYENKILMKIIVLDEIYNFVVYHFLFKTILVMK